MPDITIKEKINSFEILRERSPFCNLSLANNTISWDECHTSKLYPYAYILYEDSSLQKFDELMRKFDIEGKGSRDFKNRIKNPIFKDDANELNQYNTIESALSELLIADFLSRDEEIADLQAWNGDEIKIDIKSED